MKGIRAGIALLFVITTEAAGSVWQGAASMQFARYQHTASLMEDGRVLVAGGRDTVNSVVDTVELFDTMTGRWRWIPAPFSIGADATSVTLLTGEVMIVGGAANLNGRVALFNPRDDSWRETAPIPDGRSRHTATLLLDGRVLIVGGRNSAGTLAMSSYLYDRQQETWTIADAPAGVSREGHTATRLSDGRVLVVGGSNGAPLSSVATYAPGSGIWSPADPLPVAQMSHTTTLLGDGRALVVGGTNAFLFNPATPVGGAQWTATGSLTTSRSLHVAALLQDGRVIVAAGGGGASTEIYDPAAGNWTAGPSLIVPVSRPITTMLPSGELLLAGGRSTAALNSASAHVAILHIDSGAWQWTGPMSAGRHAGCNALLPDGRLMAIGGWSQGGPTGRVEFYARDTGWTASPPMPGPGRLSCRATVLQSGEVLVTGGAQGASGIPQTYTYDPATDLWTFAGLLNESRSFHTATLLPDGRVLVVGGAVGNSILRSAEVWSAANRTWTFAGSMAEPRYSHDATLLPLGRVLVTGGTQSAPDGFNGFYEYSSTTESFDIDTGTWSYAGQLLFARAGHQAVLSASDELLLVGGLTTGGVEAPDTEMFNVTNARGQQVAFSGREGTGSAFPLPAGRLLFAGGQSANVGFFTSGDLFSRASRGWVSTALPQEYHTSYDFSGRLLNNDVVCGGGWQDRSATEVFRPYASVPSSRFPEILTAPTQIAYGVPWQISGHFRADSEGSSGTSNSGSASLPMLYIESLEGSTSTYLLPETISDLAGDPLTLTFGDMPPVLDSGFHRISVIVNGVPSASKVVRLACSVAITDQPDNVVAALGETATFAVASQGGRFYRWQRCITGVCAPADWTDIPGATSATYTTGPTTAGDAGTRYRVLVGSGCVEQPSNAAVLTIADITPPQVTVVSPSGGEFWLLSTPGNAPNQRIVIWSMSDNVRVCRVIVSLLYSNNGGTSYDAAPAAGGLPASFGTGASCAFPGETTTSVTYTVPTTFPSGTSGSLYKVQVVVTDQANNERTVTSENPFYVVQSNPDSVKTLILSNISRMVMRQFISPSDAASITTKLHELAGHPRVQGLVVDLNAVTSINALYATWDEDASSAIKANAVLFAAGGIHDYLRTSLLPAYSGVENIVLVGDDRIIPMARLQDHTPLLPESTYTNGIDLTTTGTTVGRALAGNNYLTDDPLMVLDPIGVAELNGNLFLPDLAVGRLVETPQEIVTTIATYISQDGILDLSLLDPVTGHKVLVTGYDFLSNVAAQVSARWRAFLTNSTVDRSLVGGTWSLGSVEARTTTLRSKLGQHYGLMAIGGHATHYEEGVPGGDPFDIQGLKTADLYGPDSCATPSAGAVDLSGGVIYAVGCHGGLNVSGSCSTDENHSLDLPQTMLARGAVAYIANSGYGWGLRHGIGYGARLMQIFTEQMTTGGTIHVGEAVRQSKLRYYLETPRYDPYDEKTVMQWTLYGLPMYAVRTGIAAGAANVTRAQALSYGERLGAIRVKRQTQSSGSRLHATTHALPASLTQLSLSFDFTAADVYTKHDSSGATLPPGPGCPDPEGCYYTLNGLVDRGSGSADLPIQPYLIYDSRLSGSSEHGVLWKGGTYDEESNWTPVIAELVSNGGDGSNHGSAPRKIILRPTSQRVVPGADSPTCRTSDLELNSLTVSAGEAVQVDDGSYSITRRYRTVELEAFYFNDRSNPMNNCDRSGPSLGAGPFGGEYHQVSGFTVNWAVPAGDPSGTWRVLVVYNPNTVDGQGRGSWIPVELANDGSGTFRGNTTVTGTTRLTYVIEAVDNRGNITWLDYVTAQLPASGIPLGVPRTVDIAVGASVQAPTGAIAAAVTTTSIAVSWNPAAGASSYDIYRRESGTNFVKIGSSATATFTDNGAAARTSYLYSVKAIDANSTASSFSSADLATTVLFTDPSLAGGMTPIKAAHITELLDAVNAVRALAGQNAYSFPLTIAAGTAVQAAPIANLRTALDAARSNLGLPAVSYTDATLIAGATAIIAPHVTQLREGTQ